MIHHISIAAQNPLRVASVLAEIWHGKVFNFPNPGSYAVFAFDEYGTGIEVFPLGSVCVPGSDTEPSKVIQTSSSPDFVATHAAISVPASQQQIEQIGRRENWQVALCDRGPFKVIEFWVENWLMLEFCPLNLQLGICSPSSLR
ncbi:hypothetical protein [Nostoc sp. FACHB-152]|uniref:hypothetical protein n=1 Tax=Nostoc sp. FACHB-152 TaxID=2692837 RepID=UPI0028C48F0F|nr:hypothetical protein [Nostoc sp. FACHB-152]